MKISPKFVILDRDGVINLDSDYYIKSPLEWIPFPNSLEAIAKLNQAGYQVIIVTNQSGIGRGLLDMTALNAIHAKLHSELYKYGGKVSAIFFCPHIPEDQCDCRKPKPGMLEQISRRFQTSLKGVAAVGDSLRDLQAYAAAGCVPHLVRTGKGLATLQAAEAQGGIESVVPGTTIHEDLASFVDAFIAALPTHKKHASST